MDIATYLDMYSDARNLLYMNVPDSFLIDSRLILVTPDLTSSIVTLSLSQVSLVSLLLNRKDPV